MSEIPEDVPATCPACGDEYDSVSVHPTGLMVSLIENERYRRVCFEPGERDEHPVIYFYHHTHQQADVRCAPDTEPVAGSESH
jgi:hypothetical protein